jgi:hypothetical protein
VTNNTELRALLQREMDKLRREMGRADPEQDDEPRGW